MNGDRLPLFCDIALTERIERVEAQLIAKASEAARRRRADGAGFVIPIAGGVASFAASLRTPPAILVRAGMAFAHSTRG